MFTNSCSLCREPFNRSPFLVKPDPVFLLEYESDDIAPLQKERVRQMLVADRDRILKLYIRILNLASSGKEDHIILPFVKELKLKDNDYDKVLVTIKKLKLVAYEKKQKKRKESVITFYVVIWSRREDTPTIVVS